MYDHGGGSHVSPFIRGRVRGSKLRGVRFWGEKETKKIRMKDRRWVSAVE